MSSSHEDLDFFGKVISTSEEEISSRLHTQTVKVKWESTLYHLEAGFDDDEKKLYVSLSRNDDLCYYQNLELTLEESKLSMVEQVRALLKYELDNLNSALRLIPKVDNSPQSQNGLGLYFYVKNLFQESKSLLEKAVKQKPDFSEAYRNLSNVLLKLGQPQEAVNLLERAVHLNPGFADLHNALGWVYLECGRRAEAQVHFNKAIELNPKYSEAYLNLCLSHLQAASIADPDQNLPAPKEARDAIKKAVDFSSQNDSRPIPITSWEDVSRQYLILKDQQAGRDTTFLRACCELFYLRYMKDRPFLSLETAVRSITWISEQIERGNDYADLRNYLGTFYAILGYYFAELSSTQSSKGDSATQGEKDNETSKHLKNEVEASLKQLRV